MPRKFPKNTKQTTANVTVRDFLMSLLKNTMYEPRTCGLVSFNLMGQYHIHRFSASADETCTRMHTQYTLRMPCTDMHSEANEKMVV